MRADRLLSILMYMQTRGRTTTERLSEEFEVSQRTIIRDVYALRVAGFPVYTERGPHGGCYLHDEYRTALTQLSADEIAALFLSSIQQPLEDLGLSQPLRAAVLKLTAALPPSRREAHSRMGERVCIDPTPWEESEEPVGHLASIHRALMEERWVRVTFVRPFDVLTQRRIAPYGLVSKAGAWFVVWAAEDGRLRVDRVSVIRDAAVEDVHFERLESFDLQAYWARWRKRLHESRPSLAVKVRVRKQAIRAVMDELGERRGIFPEVSCSIDEWEEIDVTFPDVEEARRELLALGGAVEVLAPEALRRSMADFAGQIAARYST
jgi:predicted DNA-binding transcriptional regulator YafY